MWRERGRFSPQKEQTGRKKQTKSNRAVGPQNDSKEKKRPAMERERSCCRRENVIKYPGSWANAPFLRDWETDLSRFCRRGAGTEFTDTAGRGHTPGWLLSAFGRFTFSPRPTGSPSSAPVCALGHLPPGRGKAGRAARCAAPTAYSEAVPPFFVGAGHWPAHRCTRRVQEAAPYSPAPASTCSAKPGAVVEPNRL